MESIDGAARPRPTGTRASRGQTQQQQVLPCRHCDQSFSSASDLSSHTTEHYASWARAGVLAPIPNPTAVGQLSANLNSAAIVIVHSYPAGTLNSDSDSPYSPSPSKMQNSELKINGGVKMRPITSYFSKIQRPTAESPVKIPTPNTVVQVQGQDKPSTSTSAIVQNPPTKVVAAPVLVAPKIQLSQPQVHAKVKVPTSSPQPPPLFVQKKKKTRRRSFLVMRRKKKVKAAPPQVDVQSSSAAVASTSSAPQGEPVKLEPTKNKIRRRGQHFLVKKKRKQKVYKTCHFCQKVISANNYTGHVRLHTGERPFSCLYCQRTFQSSKARYQHRYQRSQCSAEIPHRIHRGGGGPRISKSDNRNGISKPKPRAKTRPDGMPILVPQVPIPIPVQQDEDMSTPMPTKTMKQFKGKRFRVFTCPTCRKQLGSKQTYMDHLNIHTGELPYLCYFCSERFYSDRRLNEHHKICKNRKKALRDQGANLNLSRKANSSLKSTIRIKSSNSKLEPPRPRPGPKSRTRMINSAVIEKPVQTQMNKALTNIGLKENMGGNCFRCPICRKSFSTEHILRQHLYLAHGSKSMATFTQQQISLNSTIKTSPNSNVNTIIQTSANSNAVAAAIKTDQSLTQHKEKKFKNKPKFKCPYCTKVLRLKQGLNEHMRLHTGAQPYSCPWCPAKFHSYSSKSKHKAICQSPRRQDITKTKTVTGSNQVKESESSSNSNHSSILTENENEIDSLTCTICNEKFWNQQGLTNHMIIHSSRPNEPLGGGGEHKFKCKTCPMDFGTFVAMWNHRPFCEGNKEVISPSEKIQLRDFRIVLQRVDRRSYRIAQAQAMEDEEDEDNQQIITNPNTIIPNLENSGYSADGRYKNRGLQCPHCNRTLSTRTTLNDHIRSKHTGQKPYKCSGCYARYASATALGQHRRLLCTKWKSRKRRIPSLKALSQPRTSDGKFLAAAAGAEPNRLPNDVKVENTEGWVRKIKNTKIDKPSTSRLSTNTGVTSVSPSKKSSLLQEAIRGGFECPYCQKILQRRDTLITHIRLHTGEKPLKCDKCEMRFHCSINLYRHQQDDCQQQLQLEVNTNRSPRIKTKVKVKTESEPTAPGPRSSRFRRITSAPVPRNNTLTPQSNPLTPIRRVGNIFKTGKILICPRSDCRKKLSCTYTFNCHMRMHTGETPYECPYCPERFMSSKGRNQHLANSLSCKDKPKLKLPDGRTKGVQMQFKKLYRGQGQSSSRTSKFINRYRAAAVSKARAGKIVMKKIEPVKIPVFEGLDEQCPFCTFKCPADSLLAHISTKHLHMEATQAQPKVKVKCKLCNDMDESAYFDTKAQVRAHQKSYHRVTLPIDDDDDE